MLSLASPVTATVLSRNWTEEARVRVNNLQLQLFAASYNNWVWYTAQNIKTTKPMIPGRPVSLDSFNAVGQILFTKIFKIKFLKFCSSFFACWHIDHVCQASRELEKTVGGVVIWNSLTTTKTDRHPDINHLYYKLCCCRSGAKKQTDFQGLFVYFRVYA